MSRGCGVPGSGGQRRRGEENRIPELNWTPSRRSELIELNILSKLVGLNGLHQVLAGKSDLSPQPAPRLNIKPESYPSGSPKISPNPTLLFSQPPASQAYRKREVFLPIPARLHRRYRSMSKRRAAETRPDQGKIGIGSLCKNLAAPRSVRGLGGTPSEPPKRRQKGSFHFCRAARRAG